MGTRTKMEIVGGMVEIPKGKHMKMPPANSGRKDIEPGEFTLSKVEPTSSVMEKMVKDAKKQGKTEIPPQVKARSTGEGR